MKLLKLCLIVTTIGAGHMLRAETIVHHTFTGGYPAMITGTLPNQDTVLEESFTLANAGSFKASTISYASGGFQPNLTLFDSSGTAIASQWATPPPGAAADPVTGLKLDSFLSADDLMPGSYVLAVTDWALSQSETATSLSDGFKSNFGNGMTFVDVQGNIRTGTYALSVNVTGPVSPTPEPASLFLMGPALSAVILLRRRFTFFN
jgi:hypothetical protein